MSKKPEEIIREEWDVLKQSGLLSQISCSAGPKKNKGIYDMFEWNALMAAPKKCPYSGYMFKFEIKFPKDYPERPPEVFCKTKNIYHMNINTDGRVCVASITEQSRWKEFQNISTVLKSIFIIFAKPNPDSPYRGEIAELYNSNPQEYEKNVKENCAQNAIKIPE